MDDLILVGQATFDDGERCAGIQDILPVMVIKFGDGELTFSKSIGVCLSDILCRYDRFRDVRQSQHSIIISLPLRYFDALLDHGFDFEA